MDHEAKTVAMGTRNVVKYVLVLVWVVVWCGVTFFTDLGEAFGGSPKQQALALAILTGVPFAIAYLILGPIASRLALRALDRSRAQR